MSNGDYREKIEEHRQSIELEEQSSRRSRSRQTGNKKKKNKNRKNPFINILLFILLGIPTSLLIYVSVFYNPGGNETSAVEQNGSLVEVQTNNTVSSSSKQKPELKIEDDSESTTNSEESTESKNEEAKKQADVEAEQAKAELAKVELAKAEKAKLEEQEKLAKQKEEQEKLANQKEEQQKTEQPISKTHTVQPNENLFRIALKYYNDASGVDKIMQANNLPSNSISVGQTLIIP